MPKISTRSSPRTARRRAELARRLGICERRVRYLHTGYKEIKGVRTPVVMTFLEQYVMGEIAYIRQAGRGR